MTRFLRAATLVFFAVHGAVALAGGPPLTCPTIAMAPTSLPNGDLATAYTPTVTSSGGSAPVAIDITHGVLPTGVNLTDNGNGTATFSGTSTQTGAFEFTITATDVNGCSGGRTYATTFATATSSTVLALTSGPNPSVFGQSLTFTATVTSGSGTPAGSVTFMDGAATLGTVALNGAGVATFTTSTLTVGTHTPITAVYAGNATFAGSTSNPLSQTVNQATTTTTLGSSLSPSVFGQSVTLTATVTANPPGAGTPTGTVNFFDGVTNIGSGPLNGSGVATLATTTLTVGAHQITATYGADTNFSGSTSNILTQTVNQASTTTTLTSGTNPSVFGQNVTFTATVAAVAPGGGTPTGTMQFKDGVVNLGAPVALAGGVATFSTGSLSVSTHSITAVYSADTNFSASTSSAVSQVVNQSATSTALFSSINPSAANQSVTFTAIVTATAPGAGIPTGTVTFFDGVTNIGSGALNGSGQATFTTSTLTVGSHSITATYNGDVNFITSTSAPLTQTVNLSPSSTALVSSVNPTVFGQSTTFTATVTGTGATGTVAFMDGAVLINTSPLVAGVATFSTGSLTVGAHSITAVYSGDSNFATSTSAPVTQTVNQAATTTTLGSNANPSVFGQSVTFTATVAPVAPGAGTPTGTVQFKDGAANLGAAVTLAGGVATFNTSSLSVSTHSITAVYSADTNFTTSTSSALSQVVNQAATTTTVGSSQNPSVFGQSVTFTATVTATAPGAGTPTGTVQFKDGAANLGAPAALAGGVATFATTTLSVASHSITAVYSADANFTTSTSAALSQVVNKAPTTTSVVSSLNPSVFQNSVTFTATVTSTSPGTPTGTVNFLDGVTSIGSGAVAGGIATFTTTTLTGGTHSITAVYSGDANFATSTSSALSQVVNKANQTITITSTPPAFGATVAPNHTYTVVATATSGLVVAITIDPASASVCSAAGTTVTFNTAGVCTINANQAGDGNWNPAPQVQQSVTVLVPATANPESHPVTGNVGIASTSSVLTNDTGTNIVIKSYGATTGAEQTTIGNATPTAQGGSVTLVAGGTYTFTPASNFTGTDSFKYIIDNGLVRPSTGTVTLNVTDRIIIVSVAGGGSCSPVTPSPCTLAVADAAPIASGKDLVFVESGTYPGAVMSLFAAQNLVGQQVSLAQAIADIGGITFAVDSVAIATIGAAARPVFNNGGTVVTLGGNNLVEYFNINPTGGSAVTGNAITTGANVHDITIVGTGAANGVNLTGNSTGSTFNFTNLVITTAGGAAFSDVGPGPAATTGGTVNITTGATPNTLTTTTGTALNVTNTTIGAGGLNFQSINSPTASANSGIIVNNVGATGGLTVTGTGAAGSGGTISNKTAAAISLTSTVNASLSSMIISNNSPQAIVGTNVNGFSLSGSSATGNAGTGTAAVFITDAAGAVSFVNDNVTGTTGVNGFNVQLNSSNASSAAITTLTVTGGSYSNSAGNGGFLVNQKANAKLGAAFFSGVTFSGNFSKGLQLQQNDNSIMGDSVTAPLGVWGGGIPNGSVTVTGCTFANNNVAASFEGGGGTGGTGSTYYRFINNLNITGSTSVAVNFANGSDSGGGTYKALVSGNHIGTAGVPNSGSAIGEGIRVFMQGQQAATVTVLNNIIRALYNGPGGFDARGIDVEELGRPNANFGQTPLNIKIVGNDVDQQYTGSVFNIQYAIYVAADAQGTGTSGSNVIAEIHGNTVPSTNPCDTQCGAPFGMIMYETVSGATGATTGTLFKTGAGATVSAEIASTNTGTAGQTCSVVNGGSLAFGAAPAVVP
jgi:hypothetical protein